MSNRTFLFLLATSTLLGQINEPYQDRRQLFSVGVFGTHHSFRGDKDGFIRPGPSYVSATSGLYVGTDTNGKPIVIFDIGGMHEIVKTPVIPEVVKNATKVYRNPPSLSTTSLRLQDNWGMEAGLFPFNSLEFGVRYYQYSWRYDTPMNPSATTVPYLKAMSWNRTAYARYTAYPGRFYVVAEAGAGLSSVSYSSGVETYLKDGYQKMISAEKDGTTVPVSVMFGFNVMKSMFHQGSEDVVRLIPFIKYDYMFSHVGVSEINRQQITVGIRAVGR